MSENYLPPLDPHKGSWDEESINRRRFLEFGFWTISGVAGLAMGGASLRFLVGDSLKARPGQWVTVGDLAALAPGQVHRVTYSVQITDVWRTVPKNGILYAYSDDGAEYIVLDATCSHLGCNVRWLEQEQRFACPCHNGSFTRAGQVISGPPPQPLSRLQTKIENGILQALI
ncbi:MAG: Cytochrome b6-f complex iron-sulfur subunit [Anaerolineae bacterium]|nr:Cytochrome b6-f complex iron-sulfur subunit [Anaerolineae bacterium]